MKNFNNLTIGLPVYNEEKYIKSTVESILSTLGDSVQIIVSDNGSDDNTVAIVRELQSSRRNVKLVNNQDGNISRNFLSCLIAADTDYFCWVGGHDIVTGDFWTEAVEILEQCPKTAWVYGSCISVDHAGNEYDSGIPDPDIDTSGLTDAQIMRKIVKVRQGTYVHGVFRRKLFCKCPWSGGYASDRCLITYASLRGNVRWLKKLSFIRRFQRTGGEEIESREERADRYRKWGLRENEQFDLPPKYYQNLKLFRIYLEERKFSASLVDYSEVYRELFGEPDYESVKSIVKDLRRLSPVTSCFPTSWEKQGGILGKFAALWDRRVGRNP